MASLSSLRCLLGLAWLLMAGLSVLFILNVLQVIRRRTARGNFPRLVSKGPVSTPLLVPKGAGELPSAGLEGPRPVYKAPAAPSGSGAGAAVRTIYRPRPGCMPREPREKHWNTCNMTSLSTAMCAEPVDPQRHPVVSFGPERNINARYIRLDFTPRAVHIAHDGGGFGPDRICGISEIASLAVPLIYKDGWPLQTLQKASLTFSHEDRGACHFDFGYVVSCLGKTRALPDHAFWGRPETFFPNYTQTVQDLQEISRRHPRPGHRKCLYAGNPAMHRKRAEFFRAAGRLPSLFDLKGIPGGWGGNPALRRTALTLKEQVEKWACLVDVQGVGYSARVHLFLASGRPLMMVARETDDFDQTWYRVGDLPEKLQPWVHYAPVAHDLHDLESSARWILEPNNSQRVAQNALAYAAKYLTLDYAVKYTAKEMLRALKAKDRQAKEVHR